MRRKLERGAGASCAGLFPLPLHLLVEAPCGDGGVGAAAAAKEVTEEARLKVSAVLLLALLLMLPVVLLLCCSLSSRDALRTEPEAGGLPGTFGSAAAKGSGVSGLWLPPPPPPPRLLAKDMPGVGSLCSN